MDCIYKFMLCPELVVKTKYIATSIKLLLLQTLKKNFI